MTYRPDIDGLRALAVLSVVLCHVGLGFPGGYVGVDVFFVISGYLITCLMLKDVDAGKFSLVHFWERRTRRILPALAFVVAASFVGGWFLLAPTAYHSFGQSVCELVLMKANIHFSHDTGYFAAASESKPLLHTWSLAVEEQFYVLVPLLFWVAAKFARRRWLEPVVMTLAAVSFIAAVYGIAHENQNTYYALWTRAWELLAGVGLAVRLHRRPFVVGVRWRDLLATAGLAAIVVPCFVYDHLTPFPGPAALSPVAGAMLLIALGSDAERKTWVHRLLSTSGAVYIGLISYSLYLWHWPLIVYFKHLYIAPPSTFEKLAIVFASIALADVTRRLIETPFRTRTLLATRPRVFAAAAVVVVALHSGGKLIRSTEGFANRLPTQVREYAATSEMDHRFMVYQLPDDVPNKLLRVGADDVVPSVLVWGDSHGMAIMPAVDRVCREQGIAARGALEVRRDSGGRLSGALESLSRASAIRGVACAGRRGVAGDEVRRLLHERRTRVRLRRRRQADAMRLARSRHRHRANDRRRIRREEQVLL